MEQKVTVGTATITTGWAIALALEAVDIFTGVNVGDLGVIVAGAAGVLQVKRYIADQHAREDAAFRLGTRAGRTVEQLR